MCCGVGVNENLSRALIRSCDSLVQKTYRESAAGTILLDVVDHKTMFGGAVCEIGLRIGVGAKNCTILLCTEKCVVEVAFHGVVGTVGTENPVGVRNVGIVEQSVSDSEVESVDPAPHQDSRIGQRMLNRVVAIAVFDSEPLVGVDRGFDIIQLVGCTDGVCAVMSDLVGLDLSESRISSLKQCVDVCNDVEPEKIKAILDRGTVLTTDKDCLKDCNFFIVTVPTPIDYNNAPDMSYVISATEEVASVLKKGDIVTYESTVYPGATEEVCVPILEEISGLKFNQDFFVGYSPERINPGDKVHTVVNTVKITSGSTPEAAKIINDVYASILENGTYLASSIKVAEAAKVIENAQRDINIAFMNEIAMIFDALGIDTNDVIDAASSKWNFLPFRPGLVGGHCISVDPYYLIEKAKAHGAVSIFEPQSSSSDSAMH